MLSFQDIHRTNPAAAPRTCSSKRGVGLSWLVSKPWVTAMKRTPPPLLQDPGEQAYKSKGLSDLQL